MHKVICDSCDKECEVPFKPTNNKPVYCSDCFKRKDGKTSRDSDSRPENSDIAQINAKLDKIMRALEIE